MIVDLDKFIPEEKKIILGGEEFDITFVPYETSLMVYEAMPILEKLENKQMLVKEEYDAIFNIIYEVFNSCKEVDKKWLRKQINWTRFQELMPVIFSAIFGTSKKNEMAKEDI